MSRVLPKWLLHMSEFLVSINFTIVAIPIKYCVLLRFTFHAPDNSARKVYINFGVFGGKLTIDNKFGWRRSTLVFISRHQIT